MPQIPDWYALERDQHARLIVEGEETREAAMISLRILIRDKHPEHGNKILDEYNAAELGAAINVAKPKPVEIPLSAVIALADHGSMTQREAIALAGNQARAADAVVAEMVKTGLATEQAGHFIVTKAGHEAAELAKLQRIQCELFPMLPHQGNLKVTYSKRKEFVTMTGRDLDVAKKILFTKADNSIHAQEAEKAAFQDMYDKVRPLIGDDEQVSLALKKLAAKANLPA